ncbi:hypothetical protein HYV85_04815 [Candidatus Woesearchaeota archaeon]|nr:hypothetical protein [Candidatus Woesearchaeota archaeon]
MGKSKPVRKQQKHAKYYEAILQLREPDPAVIMAVEDAVKSSAEDNKEIFISKRKKVTNGWDFYLSLKGFAVELGRALYNKFGGELKITKKLFSQHRQTSKLLYRITVLFRMAPFKPGDMVLLGENAFRITALKKRFVSSMNLETFRNVELDYKEVVRNAEKLEAVRAVVSKIQPHLEVIHPETFQGVPVLPITKNTKLVPGVKILVVVSGDKVWLAT